MKLGIIVPYRNRKEHLKLFAPAMKKRGQIYVIEQMDTKPFNRAKLINAGFNEFQKEFDYFAAHDVDMLPENVDYSYCEHPCHLAKMAEQFGYKLPYETYFGGVTIFPNKLFLEVNGFSNSFWGWGGEDDELRRRFIEKKIMVTRRPGRFFSLPHNSNIDHNLRMLNWQKLKHPINWDDGLNSCNYEIIHCEDFDNYTLLQVSL